MQNLSNIGTGSIRFFQKLVKLLIPLNIVLVSIGTVWLFLLPLDDYNSKCYVSENALLVGLVDLKFNRDFFDAKKYLKNKLDTNVHEITKNYFDELQFDIGQQNFSVNLPHYSIQSGLNTFGLFHAYRSANVETLIVHISANNTKLKNNPRSLTNIALFLGLAKYFSRQNYWSKDILFLMTSHESIGVQAWLQRYLGLESNSKILTSQAISILPTNIIGMISFDIKSEHFHSIRIKMEGVNGMLPNLDLFNIISFVGTRQNYIPTQYTPRRRLEYDELLHNTLTMAWNQVLGMPTGPHGPFLHYGIQGLTLEAVVDPNYNHYDGFSPVQLGNVVESYMRSLNNLLETLHQSYNFYLLPGNDHFISIGLYIPPLMCILAPLIIRAIVLWVSYQYPWLTRSDFPTDNDELTIKLLQAKPIPVQTLAITLFAYVTVGFLIYIQRNSYLLPGFPYSLVLTAFLLTFRYITPVTKENAPFLQSVLLILLNLSTIAISIVNFSLAIVFSFLLTLFINIPRLIPIILPILILLPSFPWIHPSAAYIQSLYADYEISHFIYDGWGFSAIFLIIVPLFIYKDGSN